MRYSAASDIGGQRSTNEDAYFADGKIFAVADGMGGHLAGEVASNIAIDCLRDLGAARSLPRALENRFDRANAIIYDRSRESEERRGMGTTLTACIVEDGHIYIAHVGDSRLYRLRAGRLKQLTKDHSLVAQMIEKGHLSPEEAAVHPQRSVITRALGASVDVKVDMKTKEVQPGDRYLLATDGLTNMATDDEISGVLASEDSLTNVTGTLINLANSRGGPDNVSVIAFEIEGERPPRKGHWVGITAVLAAIALLALAGWVIWGYLANGVYLGEHNGRVAIYRGVPGSIAGFHLGRLVEETDVKLSSLPKPYQSRLAKGLTSKSLADAEKTVKDYSTLGSGAHE
jgi:PPM family protein phosphatase